MRRWRDLDLCQFAPIDEGRIKKKYAFRSRDFEIRLASGSWLGLGRLGLDNFVLPHLHYYFSVAAA